MFNYDRRGRGDSGDTPYSVQREVEDLQAVLAGPEGRRRSSGTSGAVLALHAAAAGLPVTRLALGSRRS